MFSAQSRDELKRAVDDCLGVPSEDNRTTRLYGPIGKWDVSQVTDMGKLFYNIDDFNYELSNWDVNRVTDMYVCMYAIFFEHCGLRIESPRT